jgi:hypothetical protein
MHTVELFELIRKDYELGLSKREIARKRGVHRRTIRQALASVIPPGPQAGRAHLPQAHARDQSIHRADSHRGPQSAQ